MMICETCVIFVSQGNPFFVAIDPGKQRNGIFLMFETALGELADIFRLLRRYMW